ncbi:MAG TPA: M20/M25/M40 family metallo-hydrolase [Acidimicrobiales bacterium]|nr:M20/M25/M40 family metallo-hydrolase [Acidimicrobiales bacterium]
MPDDLELVELLQQLIRNRCVSSGYPSIGEESRNAEVMRELFSGTPLDVEWVEPVAGRASVVARIDGSDPDAPSLCLMGHTDVVPADPEGWHHDPFGGELIDGEVWGRGAVDMLNQTAAMALAVRRLVASGFRPRGTLVYAAVPDEECGGMVGARVLMEDHRDLVHTDYAITEVGGAVKQGPDGPLVEAYVAEKGGMSLTITVRGTPSHSSIPWGADNALLKAAEVVRRLAAYRPPTRISDAWRAWVASQRFPDDLSATLTDEAGLWDALSSLPSHLAPTAHACTHATVVPTIVRGGDKINTIPGRVTLGVNVRPALGDDLPDLLADIRGVVADLVASDDVVPNLEVGASQSPVDTPLWDVLAQVSASVHPGSRLVPTVLAAQTDARWFRPAGVKVYGFGVMSDKVTPGEYWSRFHGRNERIDVDSLTVSSQAWEDVVRGFLG